MKSLAQKNQKGAVLAFSLVMLLLLTLVSTSMIQQNKAQITISANTGQQTQTFASVESALMQIQHQLNELRYAGTVNTASATAHNHCHTSVAPFRVDQGNNITNLYNAIPGITQFTSNAVTATVVAESCISNYAQQTTGPNHGQWLGNEFQCVYTNNARNTVVGSLIAANASSTPPVSAVPSAEQALACNRLNNAGGWALNLPNANACQIEVYTLNVTFLDTTTAARTVQSKFEVNCSNDFNAVNAPGT